MFQKWQVQMWVALWKHQREREIKGRPNYFLKWDDGVDKHIEKYWIDFRLRAKNECNVIESVWKNPKEIVEFRNHLRYILKSENIGNDDFLEHLLIVKDC